MSTLPNNQASSTGVRLRAARPRYAIGIDPGVNTGLAVWDRTEKKLIECRTVDFWSAYWHLINTYQIFDTDMYVELSKGMGMYWRNRQEAAGSPVVLQSKAKMMGSVIRESELLIKGLRHVGYNVVECKPTREKKWDQQYFKRLTGWEKQANEHARDAARLCWMR